MQQVHYRNSVNILIFSSSQEVDKVYDLLRTLRKICDVLWPDKTSNIVELHLSTILKMLQLPQFNPRMNAMKELSRLIKDAERNTFSDITVDAISKWLMDNKVLSIAFSSKEINLSYVIFYIIKTFSISFQFIFKISTIAFLFLFYFLIIQFISKLFYMF